MQATPMRDLDGRVWLDGDRIRREQVDDHLKVHATVFAVSRPIAEASLGPVIRAKCPVPLTDTVTEPEDQKVGGWYLALASATRDTAKDFGLVVGLVYPSGQGGELFH